MKRVAVITVLAAIYCMNIFAYGAENDETRDLRWFLQRMRSMDHLPELEQSTTFGPGSWDLTDGNHDWTWFHGAVDDYTNVLIDTKGPGVVTRIQFYLPKSEQTRFQVFLDHSDQPTLDIPFRELIDFTRGPIPRPIATRNTYSGIFFPIPFEKHIRVQVYDPLGVKKPVLKEKDGAKYYGLNGPATDYWGRFYEGSYVVFDKGTPVKSLTWPLSEEEKRELDLTAAHWTRAESSPPAPLPETMAVNHKTMALPAGGAESIDFESAGTIREIRLRAEQPEKMLFVRLRAFWDDAREASVDAPIGYFFGNSDLGYEQKYYSLYFGSDASGSYARFPMPFRKGAKIEFVNQNDTPVALDVAITVDHDAPIPANHGYFHATSTETILRREIFEQIPWEDPNATPDPSEPSWRREQRGESSGARIMDGSDPATPKLSPAYVYLERNNCRGKYIGLLYHANWPYENWWGEGDALIWSDKKDWPPQFHGTGSECYFNEGYCSFSDKAISGIANKSGKRIGAWRQEFKNNKEPRFRGSPGEELVYVFHHLDAFQFQNSIQVAMEVDFNFYTRFTQLEDQIIHGGTAYWYAAKPLPSGSDPEVLRDRKQGPIWDALRNGTYPKGVTTHGGMEKAGFKPGGKKVMAVDEQGQE